MKNTVIKYGIMSGVLMAAMFLITLPFHDRIGFESTGLIVGYTTMVLAFLLIYFGVRSYRDTVGRGTIRFGRAFGVGMLIALLASMIYVATWEVVYYNYMPDFMDKYAAHQVEKARASGETEAQIATMKAEMEDFAAKYKNPFYNFVFTMMEPLPAGIIVSLISAGLLSRRRKPGAAQTI